MERTIIPPFFSSLDDCVSMLLVLHDMLSFQPRSDQWLLGRKKNGGNKYFVNIVNTLNECFYCTTINDINLQFAYILIISVPIIDSMQTDI